MNLSTNTHLMLLIYFLTVIVLAIPMGHYLASIFEDKKSFLSPFFELIESFVYKVSFINPEEKMNWKKYCVNLLMFNFLGFIFLFLLLKYQNFLPLNPENKSGLPFWLAINTAISFVTNTNWQAYSGEVSLSYLSQMLGLTVQNFLSAATGICVCIAVIRGIRQKKTDDLGNFWVDMVRCNLRFLLPLSFFLAILLVNEGVIQNFLPYIKTRTLELKEQILPMGPVASQVAIKQLGSNGGGFFGVNSAHPFENPTPLSNFFEMICLLLVPFSLIFTYGKMLKSWKQSLSIFAAMFVLLMVHLGIALYMENQPNPILGNLPNLEGKEWRFGINESVLWSVATTATSNGSVNAMHSSLSPLAGMIAIFQMMLGEIVFGGVGSGLYGVVLFILLTVFLAGLMVGRTPEYLGKKVEVKEMIWVSVAIITPGLVNLIFSAIACITPEGLSSLSHQGPHGLSEILYAFSSALGNNGSAFAGLNANTPFYNGLLGLGMLIGRFLVLIPVLIVACSLAEKNIIPNSTGTLPTHTPLFVILLISVIFIVGALTFFPALALGPITEYLHMY